MQAISRSAELLLILPAECDGGCSVMLPYSKSLIAGQLGMKPEILSCPLARLRDPVS